MAAKCILCSKIHGPAPSVANLWHQCTACGAVFCDDCGRNKLPGKRGLMNATRQCVNCGARTSTVSMPKETHVRSETPESGYVPRRMEPWEFWGHSFVLFLQLTTIVALLCGTASFALVGLFTGFESENINVTAVAIVGGVLFIPGEYIGIRIFLWMKRKAKQRHP